MPFNPDKWMTSLHDALLEYVTAELPGAAVYDIRMSYPDVVDVADKMPLPKTIIHFEIDNPVQQFFGVGDNIVKSEYNDGGVPGEGDVVEWEAHCHEVLINVGVWASVESGGVTARLEARQDLDRIFNGPYAHDRCLALTNGLDIQQFTGGLFVTDSINDMPVFRITDMDLRLLVYSRTILAPIPAIEEIVPNPEFIIYPDLTITG